LSLSKLQPTRLVLLISAVAEFKSCLSDGATGAVISRVYNNEGTLIKYNGRNLGEDLDNDTSSQDTSDQQEASDKQSVVCVACLAYVVCVGLKFFLVN
jgi:hypothetical protein